MTVTPSSFTKCQVQKSSPTPSHKRSTATLHNATHTKGSQTFGECLLFFGVIIDIAEVGVIVSVVCALVLLSIFSIFSVSVTVNRLSNKIKQYEKISSTNPNSFSYLQLWRYFILYIS